MTGATPQPIAPKAPKAMVVGSLALALSVLAIAIARRFSEFGVPHETWRVALFLTSGVWMVVAAWVAAIEPPSRGVERPNSMTLFLFVQLVSVGMANLVVFPGTAAAQ